MSSARHSAPGAASGIAAVLLLLVLNGTGSADALVLGGEILALTLLVPFIAYLHSTLRVADDGGWLSLTVLAAGLAAVTVKLASAVPEVVARRGGLEPALSESMSRLGEVAFIVTLVPLGVCLGAAAVLILRTRVLPVWLGVVAAVTAPLLIANGFALDSQFGPAFLLFLVWIVLAGVVLLRNAVALAPAEAAASPRGVAVS